MRPWSRLRLAPGLLAPDLLALGLLTLGLAGFGCGSGQAAGGGAERAGASGGQCLDASPSTDLCETLVSHFTRCTSTDAPRQHLIEDCRASWGGFSARANGCFVGQLGECLEGPCEAVVAPERCFWEATAASDPDSFDASSSEACTEQGQCAGAPEGWMGSCAQRFQECDADSHLCETAVALQRRYRAEVESCLTGDCEAMEDCVYAAMGQ